MSAMTGLCGLGSWSLALVLAVQGCGAQESAAVAGSETALDTRDQARREATCDVVGDPLADGSYAKLSDTGLYCDIARGVINDAAQFYQPAFPLWSDGADKRRFLRLPPGSQIDTRDLDQWVFPVGTKVWKEFSLHGKPLETRLLEKTATGSWLAITFAWNAQGDEAYPVRDGASNVLGTPYDIPTASQCSTCHTGASDMLLGVSALQLGEGASAQGLNLEGLTAAGQLSDPPQRPVQFPGRQQDRQALGYLYANCTSCHGTHRAVGGLDLSTSVYDEAVTDTAAYQTTVNVPLRIWKNQGYDMRIVPGAPKRSALLARLGSREFGVQMPPMGSERIDLKGLLQVRRWVASLK